MALRCGLYSPLTVCFCCEYRFSSLLPYLPMLMDPLVSALNGSQTLVSQVTRGQISMGRCCCCCCSGGGGSDGGVFSFLLLLLWCCCW